MEKRYFWAIELKTPVTMHRFPSRRERDEFVKGSPFRDKVDNRHSAFYQVRRIQRRIAAGEQVGFPVEVGDYGTGVEPKELHPRNSINLLTISYEGMKKPLRIVNGDREIVVRGDTFYPLGFTLEYTPIRQKLKIESPAFKLVDLSNKGPISVLWETASWRTPAEMRNPTEIIAQWAPFQMELVDGYLFGAVEDRHNG